MGVKYEPSPGPRAVLGTWLEVYYKGHAQQPSSPWLTLVAALGGPSLLLWPVM